MNDIGIRKKIDDFIKIVKDKIGFDVKIEYQYVDHLDEYMIWHDIKPLQEMELEELLGNLIYDSFYEYEIYNITFGYNVDKLNEIVKSNEKVSDLDKKINSFFFTNKYTNLIKSNLNESLHTLPITYEQEKQLNFTEINTPIILNPDNGEIENSNTKFILDTKLINPTRIDSRMECGQDEGVVLAA